jgi:hypothetical protein
MVGAIRKIGLKILVSLLRAFRRPAPAGWQRSRRPASLRGR